MKVDLLQKEPIKPLAESEIKEPKRIFWLRFILYPLIILIILSLALSYQIIFSEEEASKTLKHLPFLATLNYLFGSNNFQPTSNLEKINVLLLGMGGAGHNGAYLTDTIILVSIKPQEKKLALISIPRDLVVPIPQYGYRKVNNINAFAELNQKGSGGQTTKKILESIFDLPIHYYVRIDFNGFKQLIDSLGGLRIYVDKGFTDYLYPDAKEGYETISFKEGEQVMEGETALKYVRSRHGNNGEGSDFARSRRQQKVLISLKDQILSWNTFLNIQKINSILKTLTAHISTDLGWGEMVGMLNLKDSFAEPNITYLVLEAGPNGLLKNNIGLSGSYILEPRSGNFDEIRLVMKNIFEKPEVSSLNSEVKSKIQLEILNGTRKAGLAEKAAFLLKEYNFEILKIGNAPKGYYENTMIYDLTQGQELASAEFLKNRLKAKLTQEIPQWLNSQAQFVIILGEERVIR